MRLVWKVRANRALEAPPAPAASRRGAGVLVIVVALVLGAMLTTGASGGEPGRRGVPDYDVRELGSLGGTVSFGSSINDRRWVAGVSSLAGNEVQRAALWRSGSVTDLGTFGGPDTNSSVLWPVKNELGLISGIAEQDEINPLNEIWSCGRFFPTATRRICSAFVWENGQLRELDTLGGYNGFATGTNNRRQTVGWAENTVRDPSCTDTQVLQFHAVMWGPGKDQIKDLRPLPGDSASSATAINDRGEVVGISGSCDRAFGRFSARHMVMWKKGRPIEIRNLGGVAWNTPMAINRRGEVVGFANRSAADGAAFRPRAFLAKKPGKIEDLGALGTDPYSQALGINDARQIVGVSYSEGFATCRAFLWEDDVMLDLNELAPEYSGELCAANDINNRGEITGQAIQTGTSDSVAFVATPSHRRMNEERERAAGALEASKAPPVSWDALRSIMLRSGVRREDIGR
jgi:probable HAF family extracellular repeat protein